MSHRELILRHLEDYGSITPWEAMMEYGIMRLGARVYDLRRAGWPITTTLEYRINRYGTAVRYARYSMEGKHGHQQMPGVRDGGAAPGPLEV